MKEKFYICDCSPDSWSRVPRRSEVVLVNLLELCWGMQWAKTRDGPHIEGISETVEYRIKALFGWHLWMKSVCSMHFPTNFSLISLFFSHKLLNMTHVSFLLLLTLPRSLTLLPYFYLQNSFYRLREYIGSSEAMMWIYL